MKDEDRCGATNRQGKPCRQPKGWGTNHSGYGRCKMHGGRSPSGIKAAQAEQAAAAVATYGLPREINPTDALLEELHRTAGHVAYLGLRVGELEQEQLHGPVGGGKFSIPEEKPNVWVAMYAAERTHFTRVAKTCIEAGIAERQIKLAEDQGQLVATAIQGILAELGVADNKETPEVVRRHLTLLSGAA